MVVTLSSAMHSQDAFYENYFESQRDHIFRSVELLIYVFDIESREVDVRLVLAIVGMTDLLIASHSQKDLAHFDGCLEAIDQNSSNAKVFVLIHKMDLVPEEQRDRVRSLDSNEMGARDRGR
jgi:Ras-related GTP-binding protein A/B